MLVQNHTELDQATSSVPLFNYPTSEHLGVVIVNNTWDYDVYTNYTHPMEYNWIRKHHPWNFSTDISLKSSLIRVKIESTYGSVMFNAGLNGLLVLNAPTVHEDSDASSSYPSIGNRDQRSVYSKVRENRMSNVTSGPPDQQWWGTIYLEG